MPFDPKPQGADNAAPSAAVSQAQDPPSPSHASSSKLRPRAVKPVSGSDTSLASISTQDNGDDDSEFEGSEPDVAFAPVVVDAGDLAAHEAADYSCLQIPPSLLAYNLALYEPLRLIVCTICRICVIPGNNLLHLLKHLHEQDHVLYRKWRSSDTEVLAELKEGLGDKVDKDRINPPDYVIDPILLIPILTGVSCPFKGCLYATIAGSITYRARHKHAEWWSPPVWDTCSIQQPYRSAGDKCKYWRVQREAKIGKVARLRDFRDLILDARYRDRVGGQEATTLRVPKNDHVVHPAYEALDWGILIGGLDGTETKSLQPLCSLVELPSDGHRLYPILVHSRKYFHSAQRDLHARLDPTIRQWINSEDAGVCVVPILIALLFPEF